MNPILLGITVFVCTACYTGQTFLNRLFADAYPGDGTEGSCVFSCLYGVVVAALTFALSGFRAEISRETLLLGACAGTALFGYLTAMLQAARRGPYAFQSVMMLFGELVICLLFSALFWKDALSRAQIAGILLMACAFVLMNSRGLGVSGARKGYFFWVAVLFLANGAYGVLMDAQHRVVPPERNGMIIVTFLFASAYSALYLFLSERGRALPAFRMGKKAALLAAGSSLCAGFAVYLLMRLLPLIPFSVLYAVVDGGILALSLVLSAVFLKERMTPAMKAGAALSLVSIVLMCL